MTTHKLDDLGAKLQACCINFNDVIRKEFGDRFGLKRRLPLALQFVSFDAGQRDALKAGRSLPPNVETMMDAFHASLSDEQQADPAFAYRVAFVPKVSTKATRADAAIEFVNLRLLVTIPPRNGKSKTISVIWVAWMLGRNPKPNFVCVSYSNELSAKLARDCIAVMRAPWYKSLFPRTVISERRFAATDFETTAGGGRLATSVTGTLTGRGGDIIILDDVIKPEEANSETTRNAVNGWYQSTLASRLNDKHQAQSSALCSASINMTSLAC